MFFVIAIVATAAGTAAAKGTTKIRELMNEGKTVKCNCAYCGSNGPHYFKKIDRSWTMSGVVGFLTGGAGGIVSGIIARKLYTCCYCERLIHEDGSKRGWNADEALSNALDNFVDYPKLEEYYEELASLNQRCKVISQKEKQEIDELKKQINKKNIDYEKLEQRVITLISKLKRDNNIS